MHRYFLFFNRNHFKILFVSNIIIFKILKEDVCLIQSPHLSALCGFVIVSDAFYCQAFSTTKFHSTLLFFVVNIFSSAKYREKIIFLFFTFLRCAWFSYFIHFYIIIENKMTIH